MSTALPHRRVVVTGLGLVTSLGVGVENVWSRIISGECGLSRITYPEYDKIPCKVAGFVPRGNAPGQLNLDNFVPPQELRGMALATAFSLVATQEAVQQANWIAENEEDKLCTGVAVGMGMVGLDDIVETGIALREKGYSRVSPHFVPRILTNMAAGHISLKYDLKGPNHAVSTACATGLHAIGDASRFIKHGDANVMICGGTEACVSPLSIAGFARMRALSTKYNDEPQKASRPFDEDRDGFVMSEGAGILVLEEYSHALKRGAKIYAEILGYGLAGDTYHMTAPDENGDGAYRCMRSALKDANISANQIGYINAHATSTPLGDLAESRAIQTLFQEKSENLYVSSTKGAIGHLLGAAGSVESIFTVMAVFTGIIPPTINLFNPDKSFSFKHVPHKGMLWDQTDKRIALTNSFGFGGTNASLCIGSL